MTEGASTLAVPADAIRWYLNYALDQLANVVDGLGDDLANRRPALPGANSPYAIVTHCLGVLDYWLGRMVAGRSIERDRDAEFRAGGTVSDLLRAVAAARARAVADLVTIDPLAPPRHPPDPADADLPYGRSQAGVLLHVLEELLQHLGQLEVTRDVLLAGG